MALVKQIKNSDIFLPETVVTEEDKQELKQLVELLVTVSIGLLKKNNDLERKLEDEKNVRIILKDALDVTKGRIIKALYNDKGHFDNMTLNDVLNKMAKDYGRGDEAQRTPGKVKPTPLNKEPAYEERKYIIDADGKSKEVIMHQYIVTTDQVVKHVEAHSWEKAKDKLEGDGFKVTHIYQSMKDGTQHQWY